ncbi:MAG: large conductance mechanosensitive channel protein MscL [Peptococcaceae bacterium]|nr:large conductance mechanosensitive channel protein MscL [Peptococcaceae bacterium]
MFKEFKDFAMRGNVLDMAVGVIIGAAFGKIVASFVNDVLMPPIGLLFGKMNFSSLYINLSGQPYASLTEAKAAGAATINYGIFFNNILDFLIVAAVIFLFIRQMNKFSKKPAEIPVTEKECPYCFSSISIKAKRCPNCTSEV